MYLSEQREREAQRGRVEGYRVGGAGGGATLLGSFVLYPFAEDTARAEKSNICRRTKGEI